MTFISKPGPKGDPGPQELAGLPIDQCAIAGLTDGDLVLFGYSSADGGKFTPIRFAIHADHKLTLSSNGDFIILNLAS